MAEFVLLLGYIVFAVFLIVDPDILGQATGWLRGEEIDEPSTGGMVRFVGCAMLAMIPGGVVGRGYAWWAGALLAILLALVLFALANRILEE